MKNVLVLSKNYSKYTSGYYHNDIIEALRKNSNCYVYGPGYPNYKTSDSIKDVLAKSSLSSIDVIVCSTSWDDDESDHNVDPHPSINLSEIKDIPKIYFLNKEYKKLTQRLDYAKKNGFDLVLTVHPDYTKWAKSTGLPIVQFHFGINLDRFQNLHMTRPIDFTFSGGLHKSHTDSRFLVKKTLFQQKYIDKKSNIGASNFLVRNYLRADFASYNIRWMEWGAKNYFNRNLLPSGIKYVKLLNISKLILNTPSAIGIFNTRFLEAMACGAVIMCPSNGEYNGILRDGINCVMYKPDLTDFPSKLRDTLSDDKYRKLISNSGYECVKKHSYDSKIKKLLLSL